MENTSKNKPQPRIYEDQTQLQQFIEPEWMKILKRIMEKNHLSKVEMRVNT